MTKFFTACLLSLLGTVSLGMSGCEQVLLNPESEDHSSNDTQPSAPSIEVAQPAAEVRIEPASAMTQPVSKLATVPSGMRDASLKRPRQAVVLELTIRELQLELDLKEEEDPARREALQGEIADLRAERQSLYQQETKGDQS
jgi:hypothetical protein